MKKIFLAGGFFLSCFGMAQTFTMSNNCTRMLKQAEAYNSAQMYDSALAVFTTFDGKCTAKDAKFKGRTAKAHALNGLEQYAEAVDASNEAIKANNRHIAAYFERAVAYAGLGMITESKADYQKIIDLSAKNQDVASRASIYAMLADISFKQGQADSAFTQLDQAIALNKKPEYYIQRGDMYFKQKNYVKAFEDYDNAVSEGKNDFEMYAIRSAQRLRIYQQKYGTDNITELSKKMTADEKKLTCAEMTKLKSFGRKNMKFDLAYTFLCD